MSAGKAPRLLLAGAFFLGTAAFVASESGGQTPGKQTAEVRKSKAKKPTPARQAAAPRQPAWGSMPAATPLAMKNIPGLALTRAQAVARHQHGLEAERAGDDHGALKAFHEAAAAGHAPAQVRLGEIYDRGNSVVERDYATALGWYQKAREQGVPVPKPHTFPAGR